MSVIKGSSRTGNKISGANLNKIAYHLAQAKQYEKEFDNGIN